MLSSSGFSPPFKKTTKTLPIVFPTKHAKKTTWSQNSIILATLCQAKD
jgi:hypothetical protein